MLAGESEPPAHLGLQADGFLSKPLQPADLIRALSGLPIADVCA